MSVSRCGDDRPRSEQQSSEFHKVPQWRRRRLDSGGGSPGIVDQAQWVESEEKVVKLGLHRKEESVDGEVRT
ncbi:unnamed protein product [Linum trigynum]|uniref:Uncharacterized protein n=1 Tax=Linum trigynum TaxID=586398 RepID=A0AAV2FTY3_9ROSI